MNIKLNSRGVISPLIFIYVAVAVLLLLFLIIGNLPIKDRLLGSLFPQMASQAAGVVDLELIPNTLSVAKDQTFLVDVAIDAKNDEPTAMILVINYDPSVLQATAAEQGFFFTNDLDPATPKINNGTIQMTLGQKPNQYKTGNGIVATLEFKALAATSPTSMIIFDQENTQLAALGKTGNQIGLLSDSTVTVSNSPLVTKTASFSLSGPASITAGSEFSVNLRAETAEAANLFASSLNFNPDLLEVISISTSGSFITQWVNDDSYDNDTGVISLIGGVPAPGYSNGSPANMATVSFKAKSAGEAAITFGANSAIYRNSDNKDILVTPVEGTSVTITGLAPSPSPSIVPSPVPSPSASAQPSVSPSEEPSAQPSPSTIASVMPSPSGLTECNLTSANWVTSTNPVTQGKVVGLNVVGSGNCAGQSVSFSVWEDDNVLGVGGVDPVRNTPPTAKFNSNNVATSNWLGEYQTDPSVVENNVPEYFFIARLGTGGEITSANPQLKVLSLGGGQFLQGDFDKDSAVSLVDLSILLSNWNKTSDFLDELDLNEDGSINTVDWSTMLQILRVGGVIK